MENLTIPIDRCLQRLACRATVLLALLCGAEHASAGGEAGPAPGQALTYSEVVRLLGEPPVSNVKVERWEPKPAVSRYGRSNSGFFEKPVLAGGEYEFAYPALGLTFVIDRLDRPLANPPIRYAHHARNQRAEAPAAELTMAASTALGLYGVRLGQPQSLALEAAAQHMEPLESPSAVSETQDSGTGPVSSASFAGSAHRASLLFRNGTLTEVWLDYKPQRLLTRTQRWSLAAGAVLAVAAIAWAAAWAMGRWKISIALPIPGGGTTRVVGNSISVVGGLAAAVSLLALLYTAASLTGLVDFGRGNAYAGMALATLGFYGLSGLVGGAVLLVVGQRISSTA